MDATWNDLPTANLIDAFIRCKHSFNCQETSNVLYGIGMRPSCFSSLFSNPLSDPFPPSPPPSLLQLGWMWRGTPSRQISK